MNYLYFAKLTPRSDGEIEVIFPDLAPHVTTTGPSVPAAIHLAQDALAKYLLKIEELNSAAKLPPATDYRALDYNQDAHELLIPIEINTTIARDREENRMIKKTLTIPKYLNDLGNQQNINFSATLTTALKEKLNA